MKPRKNSLRLYSATRSKAKMFEYYVPINYHIQLPEDPAKLFSLTIGILGDYCASINREDRYEKNQELKKSLLFSARYFDSYIQTKLNTNLSAYFSLWFC